MTNEADKIRAEIDRTRSEVGHDVDAIAEKVSPSKAASRQADKVRDKVDSLRESVMGSSDDGPGMREKAGDWADQAGHAVQDAPEAVKRKARGNPLAAGLIAFGAGWLISSLIPASRAEQDVAVKARDSGEPFVETAKQAVQEAGDNLKPHAEQAAQSVKERAAEGAQEVKSSGQAHAEHLQGESKHAAQHVKDDAQDA